MPIILPYFWMVMIAFTARSGGRAVRALAHCAVIVPAVLVSIVVLMVGLERGRRRGRCCFSRSRVARGVVSGQLHLDNYRFLWRTDIVEALEGAPARRQVPVGLDGVLQLACTCADADRDHSHRRIAVRLLHLPLCLSRARAFLQGLLVLHAFPAMTLIIPIFLILHWVGLLDTILGVILVLTTIELPFYVFVMKGFFDAVPWDIEMSAMTDGATRRQAFRLVVLPQVRVGLIAIAVFAFIRAWEEYIFVRTLLIENKNWVMSLYLFWVSTTSWAWTTASSRRSPSSTSFRASCFTSSARSI